MQSRGIILHFGILQTEQLRNAWPVDIHVEQADGVTGLCECQGQVGGHRALADAALAGQHNQTVPDLAQARLEYVVCLCESGGRGWRTGGAGCIGIHKFISLLSSSTLIRAVTGARLAGTGVHIRHIPYSGRS